MTQGVLHHIGQFRRHDPAASWTAFEAGSDRLRRVVMWLLPMFAAVCLLLGAAIA